MPVSLPDTSSSQINWELAVHPIVNDHRIPPRFANRSSAWKLSIPVDDENPAQPGRSGFLTVGSELRQLLHKTFGEVAAQKSKGFQ